MREGRRGRESRLAATHRRDVHYGYGLRDLPLNPRFDSPTDEGVAWGRKRGSHSDCPPLHDKKGAPAKGRPIL